MSSPASTPSRRGSKRGRSSNPPTRKCSFSLPGASGWDDSTSTGDLQPMRTSPAVDMQSPNAQDVLFSSPPQFRESACHHTD
uniref:Uncharacterized protein n=1 Tax=Chrysemys picta bellii TaxID=8478 RepID=A0A8C3I8K7_CHRPI